MSDFEIVGGENVWQDIGFSEDESRELEIRFKILNQLQKVIIKTGLKQKEIADILGIDQPKVSKLVNGKLSEFTVERLIGYLNKLGYEAKISFHRTGDIKTSKNAQHSSQGSRTSRKLEPRKKQKTN